jgi:hypothetical protein
MFNLFKKEPKPRTLLEDVQEVSSRVIVKSYRKIAAIHGCAPTAKTTDAKIMEIYSTVLSAFGEASKKRGEDIPALYLNHIVAKFYQVYEMFHGSPFPQRFQEHLQYEVNKYLAEGLRPDYKQELQLFDPNSNDPDVKRLHELQRLTREAIEKELFAKREPIREKLKIKQPFYGELFIEDPKLGNKSLYIYVHVDETPGTLIRLHNQPPPFTFSTHIGDYGESWLLKKVKTSLLVSVYEITFLNETPNVKARCVTGHEFGGMLEEAIRNQ